MQEGKRVEPLFVPVVNSSESHVLVIQILTNENVVDVGVAESSRTSFAWG